MDFRTDRGSQTYLGIVTGCSNNIYTVFWHTGVESQHSYWELKPNLVALVAKDTPKVSVDFDPAEWRQGISVVLLDKGDGEERCELRCHKTLDGVVLLSFGNNVYEGLRYRYTLRRDILRDALGVEIPFAYIVDGSRVEPRSVLVECDGTWHESICRQVVPAGVKHWLADGRVVVFGPEDEERVRAMPIIPRSVICDANGVDAHVTNTELSGNATDTVSPHDNSLHVTQFKARTEVGKKKG